MMKPNALTWRNIASRVGPLDAQSDEYWAELSLALRAFKLAGDPRHWHNFAALPEEDRQLLSAWYETMLKLDEERATVAKAIDATNRLSPQSDTSNLC
jgi:hypothetical protein